MEEVVNEVPRDEEAEAGETGGNDDDVCQYCGNQPCYVLELKPMFLAIMQAYQDDKTHKQLRFQMYTESVKCIFGTGCRTGNIAFYYFLRKNGSSNKNEK